MFAHRAASSRAVLPRPPARNDSAAVSAMSGVVSHSACSNSPAPTPLMRLRSLRMSPRPSPAWPACSSPGTLARTAEADVAPRVSRSRAAAFLPGTLAAAQYQSHYPARYTTAVVALSCGARAAAGLTAWTVTERCSGTSTGATPATTDAHTASKASDAAVNLCHLFITRFAARTRSCTHPRHARVQAAFLPSMTFFRSCRGRGRARGGPPPERG